MKILGIETSCDETSAAIVEDGWNVLSQAVLTQTELHREYSGVVPEIASRAHLENINSLVSEVTEGSGLKLGDMDAFAVTNRPGLVGSLIIGAATAKAFSLVFQKPLIGVNHLAGHLYSCFLGSGPHPRFPFIGLIVSGGHTLLVRVTSWDDIIIMGTTIDDAVGEAFDKVARILGLPYPGGPAIDELADAGDPDRYPFPEITMYNKKKDNFDFSYSGLKTAVLFFKQKNPGFRIEDVCASFRKAAIDVLFHKTLRLADSERIRTIVIAGGVSANSRLRRRFTEILDSAADPSPASAGHDKKKYAVFLPLLHLTTDNAAMIAGAAHHIMLQKKFDLLSMNVYAKNDMTFATR
jgi:N6-L-threonylcarbamoyladenine synthase